jgi:hypothetical protein
LVVTNTTEDPTPISGLAQSLPFEFVPSTSDEDEDEEETKGEQRSIKVGLCRRYTVVREGMEMEVSDYSKQQACYFCGNLYSKLPRHLESVHSSEEAVQEMMKFPKKSAERN